MKTRRIASVMAASTILSALWAAAPITNAATSNSQVTVGLAAISSLDPAVNNPNVLLDEGTLFEGLYGFGPNYQIEPKVAQSYKVSDGGKVWTFFLRKDARWSNGQPVTANDFYYAWMRVASSQYPDGLIWASVMEYVKNAWNYHSNQVPASQVGLKVINPYEIQLTLQNPYNILPLLALSGSMPLYKPDMENNGANWDQPQNFVGNGPYVVKTFVVNGRVELVRNPYYKGHAGEVNVGNVQQINVVQAPSVPVEDFMNHSIDIVPIGNASDFQYIQEHKSLKDQVHSAANAAVVGLEWDHSVAASPLDNVKVRQAIGMAIDRSAIIKVLNGMAQPATAMGPSVLGAPKYEHALPFNVTKAQKLLADAGYPNGKGIPTLDLYTQPQATNPQYVYVAEALAQEFKTELGINFKIVPVPSTIWSDMVYSGLNKNVNPGYVISWGSTSVPAPATLTVQGNQTVTQPGALGDPALRSYAASWYFDTYASADVKALGDPSDAKEGTTLAQWKLIQEAAAKDSTWLNAFAAKQPKWYQDMNAPQPGNTTTDILNNLLKQWKAAKTPTDKHNVWVTAWKVVGTSSLGNGQTQLGLNGQVYLLQHESPLLRTLTLETDHLGVLTSLTAAEKLAAEIDNTIMQQGFEEPLYIPDTVYLEPLLVTGQVGNPYFWNGFSNLQYLNEK